MVFIDRIVDQKLKEKNIKEPVFKTKSDFTKLRFILRDPVTDEVIKTLEYLSTDFRTLDATTKLKLKKLQKEEFFDEDAFISYKNDYNKEYDTYLSAKNVILVEVLDELKIPRDVYEKTSRVIDCIQDNFGCLDDFNDDDIAEFEEELIYLMK